MADDLGYGDLSAFRDGWIETPNLERMAAEGMRLTDFHAGGPVCTPTRVSLLTGRYQQRAGLPGVIYAARDANRHHGLQPEEFTFAELAAQASYATGIFGKWHLGYRKKYNPTRQGFDAFRGFVSGNVDYFSHVDGIGVHDWWNEATKVNEDGYSTHLITQHALDFIERHRDEPFLLYVAHEAPHYPYQGPEEEPIRKVGGELTRPPPRRAADRSYVRSRYRQMVKKMDQGIGQIMETLRSLDLAENTLVLFFSDNGPNKPYGSAGSLRGWKGSVFEGGHRVPALAWWPTQVAEGSRSDELMITLDVLPTIAILIEQPPPEDYQTDGRNVLPVLLEKKDLPQRQLFWEWKGQQAMREGPWKLVRNAKEANHADDRLARSRLFDLGEDLAESNNLAQQYPERVRRMEKALAAWKNEVTTGATQQPSRP